MPSPPAHSDYLFDRASSPSIVVSNQLSLDTTDLGSRANQRSCTTCRRRKVKCNKERPCSNCIRNGVGCIFPPPGRARPTPRGRQSDAGRSLNPKEDAGQRSRSAQVARIQQNNPDTLNGRAKSHGYAAGAMDTSVGVPSGRPIRGFSEAVSGKDQWIERSLYFGEMIPKNLYQQGFVLAVSRDNVDDNYMKYFTRVAKLLGESPWDGVEDEDFEAGTENDDNHSVDRLLQTTPTNIDQDAFILGCNPPDDIPSNLHPSPSQIPFYWQTFVENVDPLIKIFHIPTMDKFMREIQRDITSLSPPEDALMFVIYLAAVTSMSQNEVHDLLGQDKDTLVARYRLATKRALARADFMSTSNLTTLQAIVLFLFCLRESDQSRFVWTMTALAVRLAKGLGLHQVYRRPKKDRGFNLSRYDTEINLRLWLSIWLLDLRTAIDQGTEFLIPEVLDEVQLPLNIDDADFDPASDDDLPLRTGMTEMAPNLIKYKIGVFMKKGSNRYADHFRQENIQRMATECKKSIEDGYFMGSVDDHSFYQFTTLTTRLFFAELPLVILHPSLACGERDNLSSEDTNNLLDGSIKLIQCSHEIASLWTWPRWAKQPCNHVHWYAMESLLAELCTHPERRQLAPKIWNAIDLAIGLWGSPTQQDGLWKPLMRLARKAREKRETGWPFNMHGSTGSESDTGGQQMSVDWNFNINEVEAPLWPTELSPGYLYDNICENFLLESGGSPSEVIDMM
ncbi:fungal-specific transcription factor domain-containing protein [Dactylonectria estremocensis]|uniref:Fungal-specific transcription factor domain-containing protein n=1 Tax=Dactylonectria estremocensis TaxID=1079267 RepID=A0A9P9J9E4_9HYPO|nr:fungal-specific transcription factor domain-containing protein [Dactylonectria estremocensis]